LLFLFFAVFFAGFVLVCNLFSFACTYFSGRPVVRVVHEMMPVLMSMKVIYWVLGSLFGILRQDKGKPERLVSRSALSGYLPGAGRNLCASTSSVCSVCGVRFTLQIRSPSERWSVLYWNAAGRLIQNCCLFLNVDVFLR
jgi:hypothetical protein